MSKSFDSKEINKRFFTLFGEKSRAEIAALLRVSQPSLSEWAKGKKQVPWDKLALIKELSGVTWDWLLEGAERIGANAPRNFVEVPVEGAHGDGITDEKRDMADTNIVEILKDHIETLKRQTGELQHEKAELKADVARLRSELALAREENKRLLTLSAGKATRRAGSA